eukprot:CAMPEP_0168755316 /NCGR_PEP_ID=MMETSP0724-20121128/19998_1 /TAXON_ID=265536 /ORGANISM="Amphiprora sp., Strain CCMP467" /LENGTH=36 /DNA_ID= /DNA_START= /DNA_END= /DNA_ORIENTATION=
MADEDDKPTAVEPTPDDKEESKEAVAGEPKPAKEDT